MYNWIMGGLLAFGVLSNTAAAQEEFGASAPIPENPSFEEWLDAKGVNTLKKGSRRICLTRVGVDFVTRAVGYAREGGGGAGRFKATYGVGVRTDGISEATYKAIADEAYDVAAEALTSRGFEVVPYDTCAQSKSVQNFGVRPTVPGEEMKLDKISFSAAKQAAGFSGATNSLRYIAHNRPDYNALVIDMPNNNLKSMKAAKDNGALMAHMDFVLDFQRHQGEVDREEWIGNYFKIITTTQTMQFKNDLYMSYVRAFFQDERARVAQFYRNPKAPLLIVPGTEWATGAVESDERWSKKQTRDGITISVNEAEYKSRALALVRAYAGMYADALKAGIKQ